MAKIQICSDVSLSAVEDIENSVFNSISTTQYDTFYLYHVLNITFKS